MSKVPSMMLCRAGSSKKAMAKAALKNGWVERSDDERAEPMRAMPV